MSRSLLALLLAVAANAYQPRLTPLAPHAWAYQPKLAPLAPLARPAVAEASRLGRPVLSEATPTGVKRRLPILDWLPKLNASSAVGDVIAGITVATMLIPQGMSYATIAGLNPIIGLYCYVPLLVYAAMGTSRFISVGPVALVSTTLYGMIATQARAPPHYGHAAAAVRPPVTRRRPLRAACLTEREAHRERDALRIGSCGATSASHFQPHRRRRCSERVTDPVSPTPASPTCATAWRRGAGGRGEACARVGAHVLGRRLLHSARPPRPRLGARDRSGRRALGVHDVRRVQHHDHAGGDE